MSILPYYLYNNIFTFILFQIYNNNRIINKNYKTINQLLNNNEIIQYSLICKKLFSVIGNILLNHILDYNNYSLLNSIISHNNNNHNHNFKIINNNTVLKIYSSLSEYENDNNTNTSNSNNNSSTYNRIFIRLNNQSESIRALNNINSFPPNVKFDLTLMNEPLEDINISEFINFNNSNNQISCINQIKITGDLEGFDEAEGGGGNQYDQANQELLNKIISLNPNRILYELAYGSSHKSYSQLFECNKLETLTIDLVDHVEPIEISKIDNSNSKLQSLTVPIFYHDILRYIEIKKRCNNGVGNSTTTLEFTPESEFHQSFRNIETITQDWNEMVQTLSTNNRINELNLINFCEREWGECTISINQQEHGNEYGGEEEVAEDSLYCRVDTSFVTLGLSTILTSPNTNIKSLTFIGIDFIDQHLISALENNNTIHSLAFQYTNIPSSFNRILEVNKNIRNLALDGFGTQINDLIEILNFNGSIGLYSISILIHRQKDIDSLLDLLKSTTFINLKEFYIFRISRERSINQFKLYNTIVTISKIGYNSYKLY